MFRQCVDRPMAMFVVCVQLLIRRSLVRRSYQHCPTDCVDDVILKLFTRTYCTVHNWYIHSPTSHAHFPAYEIREIRLARRHFQFHQNDTFNFIE